MNQAFASATQLSATLPVAKVYLATRKADAERFNGEFTVSSRDGELYHAFASGYEAHLYPDGAVCLLAPDTQTAKFFATYTQFTAYYLAKFW